MPASSTALLTSLFQVAVQAASAEWVLPPYLPAPPPTGHTVVVGAGKAAAAMARAVEDHWPGQISGLVITRRGHAVPTRTIEVVEAGHPRPDRTGMLAAGRLLKLVNGLGADDLVLCLISGGGSSLLTRPAPGLSLEDKRTVTEALLRCGAPIAEINCVRKHLSAIKGGRLAAAAAPTPVLSLVISDVPGDDPSVIASGPTVADPTTRDQALAVIDRYGLSAPESVRRWLDSPESETPKPGDPAVAASAVRIMASAQDALEAAADAARQAGITPVILGNAIEGEAKEVAKVMAAIALQAAEHGQPAAAPCVLLSGGETTVTLTGKGGRGGRNCEFALALALALNGHPRIQAIACDTDGIDGTEDNAGALIRPSTLFRAASRHLDAAAMLAAHDSYSFFQRLGDLVTTGPTLTNVNDFRAILVEA